MGKDKVLVSQSDIAATQQAAADTAALMENINSANDSIKKSVKKPTEISQNLRKFSRNWPNVKKFLTNVRIVSTAVNGTTRWFLNKTILTEKI